MCRPPPPRRRGGGASRAGRRHGSRTADGLDRRSRDGRRPCGSPARSTSSCCRRTSAVRPSSSSATPSPIGSASFDRPVVVRASFETPWTSDRISPAGPGGPRLCRDRPADRPRRHSLPVVRLRRRRPRQPVRSDPVPLALLLPHVPAAVRSDQARLIVASDIRVVGIVGAGTMGAGIGQVALEAGCRVRICDRALDVAASARDRIEAGLRRRSAKERRPETWVVECLGRLDLAPGAETAAAAADLVIEAAIEDLPTKQALFRTIAAAAAGPRDPGHEHERAVGGGHRRRHAVSGPGHRPAFLQPGPGHAPGRGRRDAGDRTRPSSTPPWR